MKLGINDHAAQKHIAEQPFSHFDGSWEELLKLSQKYWNEGTEGWTSGVWDVPVPPEKFYAKDFVPITDGMKLKSIVAQRKGATDGELPFIQTAVLGKIKKPNASNVVLIFYSKEALEDDVTDPTNDFELVMIKAETSLKIPMPPITMARNWFAKYQPEHQFAIGGTPGDFTIDEVMKSIMFHYVEYISMDD